MVLSQIMGIMPVVVLDELQLLTDELDLIHRQQHHQRELPFQIIIFQNDESDEHDEQDEHEHSPSEVL